MRPKRPLDEPPHRCRGVSLLAEHDPFPGELVDDGALGPLRHRAPIPERRGDRLREGRDGAGGRGQSLSLGALLAFIPIGMRSGRHRREPTLGVGRCRNERDGTHTGLTHGPKVWTVALEAVRHNILA